ncbi:uncharacterized protein Dwil_GK11338 [Drosophila willistoni]|uniref:Uncharacterized protein n=2 Tax=Drosophila willistoni TaxID=7260 RepID=B4NAN9_DROWI|nr:uncharacterized protein Dwil_GK11338 [Drosophila willistoni]
MIGLDKKKPAKDYVVPNNSAFNLQQKSGTADPPISQVLENTTSNGNNMNNSSNSKCPHCENMAKNFLYLESLIRNNSDKGEQKCMLCASSLKYLQYVNRNIMQVFGNTDSIVKAARSFSKQPPPALKYSVATPQQQQPQPQQQMSQKQLVQRAKGGAVITKQKSAKNLKPKTATTTKTKTKTTTTTAKSVVKSLKSNRSSKSLKSLKSVKSAKSSKSLHKTKGKSNTLNSAGSKNKFGHGKMQLKRKFRVPKQISHAKMTRSASQYHSLGIIRSKLANKAKKQKQLATKKRNNDAQPTSINWKLLKRNLPKRFKMPLATK